MNEAEAVGARENGRLPAPHQAGGARAREQICFAGSCGASDWGNAAQQPDAENQTECDQDTGGASERE